MVPYPRAELEPIFYSPPAKRTGHIAQEHGATEQVREIDRLSSDILERLTRGEKIARYPTRLKACDGSIKHVDTCPVPKGGGLFRASLTTVVARRHPRAEGNTGDIMKKTYEKPILTKREKLSAVTAAVQSSKPVIT
ncbi:hypothetical protein [Mesorhizobium sp. AR02]|uniref:hypothetical protein n=1 Tax=Mesorhizobium sp. AR02 TaxID=2865837 RepID=UPI002160ACD3|nr:hypothetical protein [Mesorhizobium sp. AR02]